MCGINSTICGVAVHPDEPLLAIAGAEGSVILWNYEKQDERKRDYAGIPKDDKGLKGEGVFRCIEFLPDGSEILIGKYNGEIAVMDAHLGVYKEFANQPSTTIDGGKPICQIVVTADSKLFACYDVENTVCLFMRDPNSLEWKLASKIIAHEI